MSLIEFVEVRTVGLNPKYLLIIMALALTGLNEEALAKQVDNSTAVD
jgi:hypothetical protein